MGFQTDDVYQGDRLDWNWFNRYVRDPLNYLKGKDFQASYVEIEDTLRVIPWRGRVGYYGHFELPSVTTAQRTAMTFPDNDSAKLVYDSDLKEIQFWHQGAWSAIKGVATLSEILRTKTNETLGLKRLAPKGANKELEWVYNRAEEFLFATSGDFTWRVPGWSTYSVFTAIGGGGGGGGGNSPNDSSIGSAYFGHGGSGGTRGQARIQKISTYQTPRDWHLVIGGGGFGGRSGRDGSPGTFTGLYFPQNGQTETRGRLWFGCRGGFGGRKGTGYPAQPVTYAYSKSGPGGGHGLQGVLADGVCAAGGGGGGFYRAQRQGARDFEPHVYWAMEGSAGGNSVYRYDYGPKTTAGGGVGYGGTAAGNGENGKLETGDASSRLFGSGGGGGGGGGGHVAGAGTDPGTADGGNGGDGLQASGGGGGGGCSFGSTPGAGGMGGDGLIQIIVW